MRKLLLTQTHLNGNLVTKFFSDGTAETIRREETYTKKEAFK